MRVKNHLIEGIAYERARQIGGVITPEIVILHDTAGRLEKGNSKDFLKTSPRVSVHFVIERDGTITQLVALNRRAAHAGKSHYEGREDCNGFSIGVEIVNPGRMQRVGRSSCRAWWGEEFGIGFELTEADEAFSTVEMSTPHHGAGVWMDYTEEQIAAVETLLHVLFRDIPSLKDITAHWYVSPGRKVDPNPLFPLEPLRARVLGRDDPRDAASAAAIEADDEVIVRVSTGGAGLNLRATPSFNNNVLISIPNGTILRVEKTATFVGRRWGFVRYGGREGWVVEDFIEQL